VSIDVSGSDRTAEGDHREAVDPTEGTISGSSEEYVWVHFRGFELALKPRALKKFPVLLETSKFSER